jgi:hypothetical protein
MVNTASDIASRMIQPTGTAPCAGCRQQVETRKNGTAKKGLQGEKKGNTVFEL